MRRYRPFSIGFDLTLIGLAVVLYLVGIAALLWSMTP